MVTIVFLATNVFVYVLFRSDRAAVRAPSGGAAAVEIARFVFGLGAAAARRLAIMRCS